MSHKHIETNAIHAGFDGDKATGAVAMPIILSTTFERGTAGEFIEGRDIYGRASNPNRRALEQKIAALENGVEAMAFSSGQAATMSVFHALEPGSHVIIPDDIYYGTRVLLESLYKRWGLSFSALDMTNISILKKNIKKNTRLIWIETPSNPSLKIADIQAIVAIAKGKNIPTACDNTWATPYFTKPLDMGVDVVMHSNTKYFSGHSDIIGGSIIVKKQDELSRRIREFQTLGGAIPSPFDCWLLYRSLATFPMRMRVHAENAQKLAEYLEKHPKIEKVHYPGLKNNTYHKVAKKQMNGGYSGMMSIWVKGGAEASLKLASHFKIIKHATSLGGVETLVDHRQTAEGVHSVSPPNLLRVSVGVENITDLIRDFEQALASL
jgi:cystathionine gamma-synthase